MEESEKLLINRLKHGDRQAFEQIFRSYYPAMCNFACRYLSDKNAAEEVVQDLFCKIWFRRSELSVNTSLKNYLLRATANHALNTVKHRELNRRYVEYIGFKVEEAADESPDLMQDELKRRISLAISSLPERRRQIFEMSRFEGLHYEEIASRMEIKVKTVESQMVKALEFLRKYLQEYVNPIVLILSMIIIK